MNIPLNGRIAIVDDQYSEVKPLMDIFSKNRTPFNYYTGLKIKDFPDDPNSNPITLLFLDLNLVESQHNVKAVIGTLYPILNAICPSQPKPFIIVVWSKKILEYADELKKLFDTDKKLNQKQPVKIIHLNKSDFFSYEEGKFIFDDNKYEDLKNAISTELECISLMKNLLAWENIVHHNTSKTINEFASLYTIEPDWDKNMKAVMFHLAKSVLGNDDIIKSDANQKMSAAFTNLNTFLAEEIQSSVCHQDLNSVTDILDEVWLANQKKDSLLSIVKAKIHSKLHLTTKTPNINSFEQGNIYFLKNENNYITRILHKKKNDELKKIRDKRPKLVQLDITPACDYSQNKDYIRLVYGLLLNAECYNSFNNCNYQFKTPIFLINKKEHFFLFDFRFIITNCKNEIIKRNIPSSFKLRKEISTDIQSQLSNQVNRPGYNSI